jgi:hypothetical protein
VWLRSRFARFTMVVAENASCVCSCACMQKDLVAYSSEAHSRRKSAARTAPGNSTHCFGYWTKRKARRLCDGRIDSVVLHVYKACHVSGNGHGDRICNVPREIVGRHGHLDRTGIGRGNAPCKMGPFAPHAELLHVCSKNPVWMLVTRRKYPAVRTSASISLHNVLSAALRIGAYNGRDAQLAFLNLHVHHFKAILPSIAVSQ